MKRPIFVTSFFICFNIFGQKNYLDYHKSIIRAEELIAEQAFDEAIRYFQTTFEAYDFAFIRDCRLAAEVAAYAQDHDATFQFLQKGIQIGWTLKSIKKSKRLKALRENSRWPQLEEDYDSLRQLFTQRINQPLRDQTKELSKKDQGMALKALFRIGDKSQTKYAEQKFAPHSEKQLAEMKQIIIENGYPGEKLVGYSWWASVIISHHNSISRAYNRADTLYQDLRPYLITAIEKGELHPYQFAIMEDWRIAATEDYQTRYGFLGDLVSEQALDKVNAHRAAIGLRSVSLRNKLLDVEKETSLNLYLTKDWQKGKILVSRSD